MNCNKGNHALVIRNYIWEHTGIVYGDAKESTSLFSTWRRVYLLNMCSFLFKLWHALRRWHASVPDHFKHLSIPCAMISLPRRWTISSFACTQAGWTQRVPTFCIQGKQSLVLTSSGRFDHQWSCAPVDRRRFCPVYRPGGHSVQAGFMICHRVYSVSAGLTHRPNSLQATVA